MVFMRMGAGRSIASLTLLSLLFVLISTLVPEVLSELNKTYSDGECETCHTEFEPFITQVDSPTEVPETMEFEFGLLVQNPWAHELNNLVLTVDLTESPGLEFLGMEPQEPIDMTETGIVPARGFSTGEVMISSPVEEIRLNLDWNRPILFTGELELSFIGENKVWTESSTDEIIIDGDEISETEYGPYQWMIENTGPARSVDFTIEIAIDFSSDIEVFSTNASTIGPGKSGTIKLPLRSIGKSENIVSYELEVIAHHDHSEDETDSDTYTTTGSYSIEVGDEYKYSRPEEIVTVSSSLWIVGRVLGFVTVALFIGSFLSGVNITPLRRWIDNKTKDRKRWHCVISFAVIISVIIHFSVLYVGYYSNTYKGLITGGIPLILMILLGMTGYWQKQIILWIGDQKWKRIHFWLSIIVILLFIFHGMEEGTDLAFLRWW